VCVDLVALLHLQVSVTLSADWVEVHNKHCAHPYCQRKCRACCVLHLLRPLPNTPTTAARCRSRVILVTPRISPLSSQLNLCLALFELGFAVCLVHGIAGGLVQPERGWTRVASSVVCAVFFAVQCSNARRQVGRRLNGGAA
jgi:nucleoside phosphorylase